MLFSEIYGSYFNVVAAVLSEASDGKLTDRRMTELVREKAFAESALAIPAALKSGTWPLLDQEYHSILHHKPTMPLTMLQKRWLKALLSDPRIALFDPDTTGLEDVDPLYAQDTFILFDQYADGDPYGDPAYIACFQTALKAIRKKRKLRIRFRGHTGARHSIECIPYRLEYSAKDDKFRLLATGKRRLNTINMARVRSCELLDAYDPKSITLPQENSEELVMLLHDERNGLERVLLHFSHFEKETQKLADRLYQIRLRYDKDDETELLIRVLSFGPVLEDFGIKGATTLCTAAATYGLIAGSMMGGPLGKMLIERHNLLATVVPEDDSLLVEEEMKHERHTTMYPAASFQLIVAMGIGTVLSRLLSLTGMTFPIYIGAMIAAAIIRNVGEYGGGYTVYMGEINDIGGICLSLFLGMAMITLKIWQLAELALPLVVLLAGQTLFMILYSFAIVYNVMGRDYDAAVIVSGTCGFGMGATPNAMANMQAVCDKYSPSVKAYLLIPLVGSLFADFINSLVITVFINFI